MNKCSFQSGQSLPAEQQTRPVIDRLAIFNSLGHCVVGMRWQGMVDLLREHVEEGGNAGVTRHTRHLIKQCRSVPSLTDA